MMISTAICNDAEQIFIGANESLRMKNYNDAIQSYESILGMGYYSSDLYYNLGNAYFRVDSLGLSIWAYKCAEKLSPRDGDIAHNISVAQSLNNDKIDMPKSDIPIKYYHILRNSMTLKEWLTFGSSIFFIYSIINLLFNKKEIFMSQLNIVPNFILLLFLLAHLIVLDNYLSVHKPKRGVVISDFVDANSEPFYGNQTILFRINEGRVIDILQDNDGWYYINLIDGKKGWVPSISIRKIK